MNINLKGIIVIARNFWNVCFQKIKKVPWILGEHAFAVILILIILEVIFVEFLFYQYLLLPEIKKSEAVDIPLTFNEKMYEAVIEKARDRQRVFESISEENYTSPFPQTSQNTP